MSKKSLNEAEICHRFISPALEDAGWQKNQIRREYIFTAGRIIVRGPMVARGKGKRADYLLFYKPNLPIAVIEAKDNNHSMAAGIQQAIGYAELLDLPFVFSSNGDGFLLHDRSGTYGAIETSFALDAFPSPDELWRRYKQWRRLEDNQEQVLLTPNHSSQDGKQARYYQQLAINRTVEAISQGEHRCLLVMATGTGKTYTAFNIIWRLWKSKQVRRVLFLADRNILVDQTIINDFNPFEEAMTKLNRSLVDKANGKVNTSFEIYLALYQAIIGSENSEPIYDKFPRDFFDLIVIDECHRGSAAEDSLWRTILDYFSDAVHLGMTATPKETKYISNIDYFGEPIYTYSLKQGIEDGFLAPFKVLRVDIDLDIEGWHPDQEQYDDLGQLIEQRTYNLRDFDRNIVFDQRTQLVAERISEFLHGTNPMHKTIVFCENVDHAERMRHALINVEANKPLVQENPRYIMQITGDNKEGKAQLDNFIDPKQPYPVIATTSRLMSTGVDAQTCHLIVLERRIQSMAEFKQIIGRGTRLRTDYGKLYFTIMDFRGATRLFVDPDWDGPPIQIYEPGEHQPITPPPPPGGSIDGEDIAEILQGGKEPGWDFPTETGGGDGSGDGGDGGFYRKFKVGNQPFMIAKERIQYYNRNGELITESLKDFTRQTVRHEYSSLDDFLRRWSQEERKQAILDELLEHGVILEAVEDMIGQDYDPFDLICHVAFDQPPLTRSERSKQVKKRDIFGQYGETARAVLEALLDKYEDQGIVSIEDSNVLKVHPIDQFGTPIEIINSFGGKAKYKQAINELETALYEIKSA